DAGLITDLHVLHLDVETTALMLYDSEWRRLADERVFTVAEAPVERASYWVGNRRVVYLGSPAKLGLQNSLAEP
ncbi:MAG: hypothetical protein Q8J74_07050, partial [Candidatus Didemnitutus sp.]|nr:hypothetical protein [Candidatus Didemnitutus sp.]